jgi:hypothetical protein
MSETFADDKEELKNFCHSAKKFVLRYVLLVSGICLFNKGNFMVGDLFRLSG